MAFRKARAGGDDPDRAAVAAHLRGYGPTPGDELAAALGMTPERFWVAINHPWFEITGKGWDLTDLGRAEGAGG